MTLTDPAIKRHRVSYLLGSSPTPTTNPALPCLLGIRSIVWSLEHSQLHTTRHAGPFIYYAIMGGVMKRFLMLTVIAMSMLGSPDMGRSEVPTPPPPLDIVTLKDGSVVYGEVIELVDGELKTENVLRRQRCRDDQVGERGQAVHQSSDPVSFEGRHGVDGDCAGRDARNVVVED